MDDSLDDGLLARCRRVLSPRRMLQRGEVSGALGDLGTFLPDVVALSSVMGSALPAASFVFFSGLWNLVSGCLFDLPLPIQPMHTVVAVALTEGLTYPQLVASGLWLGAMFTLLGGSGSVERARRCIPVCVVRGLQLGLGLKVFSTGAGMATRERALLTHSLDGLLAALLSAAVALALYGDRKRPASLVLFALGCAGVARALPAPPSLGLHSPLAPVPTVDAADWWHALVRAALPQLPVTLLNAVVATAKLAEDLYPRRDTPSVDAIALSVGLSNLSTAAVGHFPSCHGCGGLAGQHQFGARTGSSMALLGLCKMGLAVALGPAPLLRAFAAFPPAVLGVLLAVGGVELAACARDVRGRCGFVIMLSGAGSVLRLGTGAAFLISCTAAAAFRFAGRSLDEEDEAGGYEPAATDPANEPEDG